MTRQEVARKIAAHRDELRAMHVKTLALFGSAARNEARDASDVDLLVEFDGPVGYFQFLEVQDRLREFLEVPKVDLVVRGAVLEELKEDICGEAVNVL